MSLLDRDDVAEVAMTGEYADIQNKPEFGDVVQDLGATITGYRTMTVDGETVNVAVVEPSP